MGHRLKPATPAFARPLLRRATGSALGRGAVGTLVLKVFDASAALLIALVLARLLGAVGFGLFSYVIAWASVLVVPGLMGADSIAIRRMAAYGALGDAGRMRGLVSWTVRLVAITAISVAILAAVVVPLAGLVPDGGHVVFVLGMALVPLLAMLRLAQAHLRGLGHIVVGFMPELALIPALTLAFIATAWLVLGGRLDPLTALSADVAAGVAGVIAATWLLRRYLRPLIADVPPIVEGRSWFKAAVPLLVVGGTQIVTRQVDVIMLGAIAGVEAAGIYAVASRGVQLIGFATYAVTAPITPRFAALYATGNIDQLRRLATRAARITLLLTVPIAGGLMVFGGWFLRLFGDEFVAGATALTVLSFGHLLAAGAGFHLLLLIMTGQERIAAATLTVTTLANVLLNLLLIPRFGILGASTAAAATSIGVGLLLAIASRRRIGIDPTVLGLHRRS